MQKLDATNTLEMFRLAGFTVSKKSIYELLNLYWRHDEAALDIYGSWYLVKTQYGLIRIGWRKRVIEIDWSDTGTSWLVGDDVSHEEHWCHAWEYPKCLEYLTDLCKVMHEQETNNNAKAD